jgi:hypothetical protein
MISLKSKKDKKKIMKGGSITDPLEKKLIFDALFDLYHAILNDKEYIQFIDTVILKSGFSPIDMKSTYLYFIFKYFFALLYQNIIPQTISNSELIKKMYNFLIILNYRYETKQCNELKTEVKPVNIFTPTNPMVPQQVFQEHRVLEENEITVLKSVEKIYFDMQNLNLEIYSFENMNVMIELYSFFLNQIKLVNSQPTHVVFKYSADKMYEFNILPALQSDLFKEFMFKEGENMYIYENTNIQELIIIIYNFIIENYDLNDLKNFISSLVINISDEDNKFYFLNKMNKMRQFYGIFKKVFDNVFKPKIENKDNALETKLYKVINKSIGTATDVPITNKDYLRKKALDFQSKCFELIDNNNFNEDLLLFALECFKYYYSLDDFKNAIDIIEKILNLNFDQVLKDTSEFNKLYLILALLYYYFADKNKDTKDTKDIDEFNNKYINNILLAIYYFNKYFKNINTNISSTTNTNISDIITNATKNYDIAELNILIIYNELINIICDFIKDYKVSNDDDSRKLLQLLLLAYTFYKQIDGITIEFLKSKDSSTSTLRVNPIIYPLIDNASVLKYKNLSKLIEKDNKERLLYLLISHIKSFDTISLIRLFFFRTPEKDNSFFSQKIIDIGKVNAYTDYFNSDKSDLKDNIFNEILKFNDNDNGKLPYGLDILFSVYKYNYQIPLEPSDEMQKDKYKNYVLEVFKTKDNPEFKEQYEFFKTLLNIFYMNISVLYYNLFLGNTKLFQDLQNLIKTNQNINNKKINKSEIINIEFKEENKASIISTFMYHLKLLFQDISEINYENIQFLLILFNNLYTSNEDDLMKFIYAMYNKLFNIDKTNYLTYTS